MKKLFLLLVALTLAVFCRSFWAGYLLWDDNVFIQENALLQLPFLDFVNQIFTHFFDGDFLPLTLISYWLEINIFGYSSLAQHLVNLALHLGNVILLWNWLKLLPLKRSHWIFIVFVFAIHPMQSEVVMWISERKSLLAIFFALAAFLSSEKFENSQKKPIWFGLSFVFYLLSLLSKSTAVFLPILIFIGDRILHRKSWKDLLIKHFLPLLVALIWSCVRIFAYSQSVEGMAGSLLDGERLLHLPLQLLTAFGFYLIHFFLPLGQSAIYPPYQLSWLQVAASAVFASFCFWLYLKNKNPLIPYFLALVILFLGPVLQVVPRINFVNDRYLYFPIVGLAGITITAFPRVLERKFVMPLLVLVLAISCWHRTAAWVSNESLWKDTIEKNPESGIAHNNLGLEYFNQKKTKEAVAEFERASQVGQKDGTAHLAFHNLGLIYFKPNATVGELLESETYFRKSLETSLQDSGPTQYDLALVLIRQGKSEEAQKILRALIQSLTESRDQRNKSLLQPASELLKKLENSN